MNIAKMLELISVQRHDFLNHLQVISGLIQLDKGAKARNYIQNISEDIICLSKIVHLKVPEAAAAFLIAYNRASCLEVSVNFEVVEELEDCAVPGKKLGPVLENLLCSLLDYLANQHINNRELFVKIGQAQSGYECVVNFNFVEGSQFNNIYNILQGARDELAPYGSGVEFKFNDHDGQIILFLPKY